MAARPVAYRRTSGGFTLLEMVLVLFLTALLAGVVAPSFEGTLDASRLRSGASDVRTALSFARSRAISGGRGRTVSFDLATGEIRTAGEGTVRVLPEGIRIERLLVAGRTSRGPAAVRFFPDGGGEDAEIVLASRTGGRIRVRVEPLTGVAEVGS